MSTAPLDPAQVLFLSYYYPPINAVGALRVARFVKYLPADRYRGIAIAGNPNQNLTSTENAVYVPTDRQESASLRFGSFVGRVWQKIFTQNPDLVTWAPYAISAAGDIIASGKVRALVSSSPPVGNHLAALILKRRHPKLRWVADFRDPLVDSPFRTRPMMKRHDRWLERRIFKHADALTTVTDAIAEEWTPRYPEAAGKIHVIWNGFDPEEQFGPAPRPERPYRLISHVGDLYGGRHPGLLAASLARLFASGKATPRSLKLQLIGPLEAEAVHAFPEFGQLIANGTIEVVDRRVPRPEAMQAIATCDGLLLLDLNVKNLGHTVPAKLFDYLRVGRPILCFTVRDSVVDRILSQAGVPYVSIDPTEPPDSIDEKVLAYLNLPPETTLPNDWFWREFDGRRQAAKLAVILDRLG